MSALKKSEKSSYYWKYEIYRDQFRDQDQQSRDKNQCWQDGFPKKLSQNVYKFLGRSSRWIDIGDYVIAYVGSRLLVLVAESNKIIHKIWTAVALQIGNVWKDTRKYTQFSVSASLIMYFLLYWVIKNTILKTQTVI